MKSIGNKLQAAREEKGLSIDDVVRETNIAKKHIIALEAEDFSQFHAEAYVLGFLKNYGEYLGLDDRELLNQYKVLKIQEQPIPVNELLNKPSPMPRIIAISSIIVLSLTLIGGGIYFILNLPKKTGGTSVTVRQPVEYNLSEGLLEQRFYIGDALAIPTNAGSYRIELKALGEVITLSTPQGNIMLSLNQTAMLDLNGDNSSDLRVEAAEYAQNKSEMGVLLRFEVENGIAENTPDLQQTQETETIPVIQPATVTSVAQTVLSGANPYPFTLEVSFQGYCMFRWEILREAGRQNRNERYFVRGDTVNIQAQNGVRLWMSNAGVAKMQAIGGGKTVAIEAGAIGAVVVADLYWQRGGDGRYNLVFNRLEE
ncbi:MAG: helix-turn-helix domain-containing protein [Spirochaetaceae bacterium]|jgi:cytoskeletal protein RodZ|nr:helix-turn-helix domain-containing protein [Spirochaetaceae bacterium]GMO19785.1 MAG: helix-turn-helix domain-containing protein [Termitinemataceae bacterium]